MSDALQQQTLFDPIGSAEDSPARTYRWLDDVLDWLAREADCSSSSCASSVNSLPTGFVLRTSPAFCQVGVATRRVRWTCDRDPDGNWYWKKQVISQPSWLPFRNWGMGPRTAFLTLSGSESPSAASVCSLSDVLETGDVPPKYFLSAKACRGILRRAEKRGRELPPALHAALQMVAESTNLEGEERTT